MSDETPIMYPIRIPNSLREWLDGTGVMQGSDKSERPSVKAEMDALKWTGKGASGEVSLYTLGWLSDQTDNGYLEAPGDDVKPSTLKAVRDASARFAEAYAEGLKVEGLEEPAGVKVDGVTVPASFGLPVYHVRDTSRVVGFLAPGNSRFVPAEEVKAEMERAHE
ncbi:hypothetical protein ACIBAH_34825 [Streptomyces sp. NPDC051445]|uniref:hypothetical protein n=1 Tax=Streptomyces sp. NPDC051445 TaxID=3365653 RepID=UPI0037B6254A